MSVFNRSVQSVWNKLTVIYIECRKSADVQYQHIFGYESQRWSTAWQQARINTAPMLEPWNWMYHAVCVSVLCDRKGNMLMYSRNKAFGYLVFASAKLFAAYDNFRQESDFWGLDLSSGVGDHILLLYAVDDIKRFQMAKTRWISYTMAASRWGGLAHFIRI